MSSEKNIKADILIEELVEDYPQLVRPLMEMGIVCLKCGEPVWGTLKEMAEAKDMTNIDEIVDKLNEIVTAGEQSENSRWQPEIFVDKME